jgi:APA family basic amino acid/polyamine antiporter
VRADTSPARTLGVTTAALVVVADMVGTGVFTTSGFLLRDLGSASGMAWAWVLGGVLALCGALSYAELAAVLPRNGGEYLILGRVFHPAAGFVAGWVSLLVGFSAPMAAAALAFGHYLHAAAPVVPPGVAAALLVVTQALLHGVGVRSGAWAQNVMAAGKVVLVAGMAALFLLHGEPGRWSGQWLPSLGTLGSPAMAVGLIFVTFAYTGWNGAIYLAGEVRDPARSLPRALVLGTLVVTVLYVGLNVAFLAAAPAAALTGVVEVGHAAAAHLYGPGAAAWVSAAIALSLFSAVGAMTMAGSRVYQAMGQDHPRLALLARRNRAGAPWVAVGMQAALALAMIATLGFEALLTYAGFMLSVSSGLAVVGVVWLRRREPALPRPYRVPLYPLPPLVFVLFSSWMVLHAVTQRPVVALAGLATVLTGLAVHAWARRPIPAPPRSPLP